MNKPIEEATLNEVERVQIIDFWLDEISDVLSDDDFQREFFESLFDQFSVKGSLSDRQFESLRKIYERVTA